MEGLEENDTPNSNTIWTLKSGSVLTENSPITLSWKNEKGIIFEKTISIDENYMFEISQSVINGSSENIQLYPYGNLTRNGQPDTIGFYILKRIRGWDGEKYFPAWGKDTIKRKKQFTKDKVVTHKVKRGFT